MALGRVLDQEGKPVHGLTVQAFDHDLKQDNLLGKAVTDEDGYFEIVYHDSNFAQVEGGAS